jgi:hypothetical protein
LAVFYSANTTALLVSLCALLAHAFGLPALSDQSWGALLISAHMEAAGRAHVLQGDRSHARRLCAIPVREKTWQISST